MRCDERRATHALRGSAEAAAERACMAGLGFVGAEHSYGVLGYPASGAQRMVASLAVAR